MVVTVQHRLETSGQGDAHDLTPVLTAALADAGLVEGIATVAVVGSTAAITTLEFESGVIRDLGGVCERFAPRAGDYAHHLRWGDDNGSSHVRAALFGPSVTIPFTDRSLMLGTWQQVTLLEFDTGPRQREVVIQLMGD